MVRACTIHVSLQNKLEADDQILQMLSKLVDYLGSDTESRQLLNECVGDAEPLADYDPCLALVLVPGRRVSSLILLLMASVEMKAADSCIFLSSSTSFVFCGAQTSRGADSNHKRQSHHCERHKYMRSHAIHRR